MRSGFLNTSSSSESKLRDPRSNQTSGFLASLTSRRSLSNDGPTGQRGGGGGGWGSSNTLDANIWADAVARENDNSWGGNGSWGVKSGDTTSSTTTTTTTTMEGSASTVLNPIKKQKKQTTPLPSSSSSPTSSKTPSSTLQSSSTNPLKNIPLLPHKTIGVPKNALNAWYGKRFKGCAGSQISNSCFTTWNDGGMPHILKFTSVFTCPVTGERFCSGRYGDGMYYTVVREEAEEEEGVDVVWYSKKIMAEHGAAARALDCLALRELHAGLQSQPHQQQQQQQPIQLNPNFCFCVETPYLTPEDAPPLPHSRPESLKDGVVSMDVTEEGDDDMEKDREGSAVKNEQDITKNAGNLMDIAAEGENVAENHTKNERNNDEIFFDAEEEEEEKLRLEYRNMRKKSQNGSYPDSNSQVADNDSTSSSTMNNLLFATDNNNNNNNNNTLPVDSRKHHPLERGPEEAKAWLGTDLVSAMDADNDLTKGVDL